MKKRTLSYLLVSALVAVGTPKDSQKSKQTGDESPILHINLGDLGYHQSQECTYKGTGVPRDLSVLNDDYKKRIVFIDDQSVVVYQSHCLPEKGSAPSPRSVEAFFVNPQSGMLIAKQSWPTIKRRWLNERWDTQARILALADGVAVQAGRSLMVYSARLEKKEELRLEDGPRWAASVAPQGHTIHLQRIEDDNNARGEWLTSDTLKDLRSQNEMAGVVSVSDTAVVYKLAHCLQLQAIGEAPRNLYCADAPHLGLPLFLTNSDVLSVYDKGFGVWSLDGGRLWGREVTKGTVLGSHKRSLQGNRFALLLSGPVVSMESAYRRNDLQSLFTIVRCGHRFGT